jgi:hypothetical protein
MKLLLLPVFILVLVIKKTPEQANSFTPTKN